MTLSSVVPGGDDRAAQRLVDRDVDDVREVVAAHAAHVLAHAVEDDDRVVHRVAGDRQQRRDDVQRQVVLKNARNARLTSRSCSVATIAPTAKLNWKRSAM